MLKHLILSSLIYWVIDRALSTIMGHDEDCCVCSQPVVPKLNLTDDIGLRDRHPAVNQMLNDGEISFLLVDPSAFKPRIPREFVTTSAIVIPNCGKVFRNVFLSTYEKFKYEKISLKDFLILKRGYIFDQNATLKDAPIWKNMAPPRIIFREESDQLVYVPMTWAKEIRAIKLYLRRNYCLDNGYTGATNESGEIMANSILQNK